MLFVCTGTFFQFCWMYLEVHIFNEPMLEFLASLLQSLVSHDPSNMQFPFMGTRTASPRGRYGERPQRDSVWRYIWKNTTCWPATAHDVTTGVPQYKCRREDTSSAFSSSLTDLFEACKVNTGKSTVFFLLWRALARRLGSVWIRVLVIWHPMTHTTVASFVWA